MDNRELSDLIFEHTHVEYKQLAIIYEPTYRNVLYLIEKDGRSFAGDHYIELLKIYNHDNNKYAKIGEKIRVVLELKTKGYIKSHNYSTEYKLTWKGQLFRLYSHHGLAFWGTAIAAIVAIIIYLLERK